MSFSIPKVSKTGWFTIAGFAVVILLVFVRGCGCNRSQRAADKEKELQELKEELKKLKEAPPPGSGAHLGKSKAPAPTPAGKRTAGGAHGAKPALDPAELPPDPEDLRQEAEELAEAEREAKSARETAKADLKEEIAVIEEKIADREKGLATCKQAAREAWSELIARQARNDAEINSREIKRLKAKRSELLRKLKSL